VTAPELTAVEQRAVDRFERAAPLPEVTLRPFLDLAAEMWAEGVEWFNGDGLNQGEAAGALHDYADRIRSTVATVLAADPEPREETLRRAGRDLLATADALDKEQA
jgi:hypothetical protein